MRDDTETLQQIFDDGKNPPPGLYVVSRTIYLRSVIFPPPRDKAQPSQ